MRKQLSMLALAGALTISVFALSSAGQNAAPQPSGQGNQTQNQPHRTHEHASQAPNQSGERRMSCCGGGHAGHTAHGGAQPAGQAAQENRSMGGCCCCQSGSCCAGGGCAMGAEPQQQPSQTPRPPANRKPAQKH